MAKIKPFKGIRPPKELVEQVESRPYDVLDSEEARAEAGDNEKSLYHTIGGFGVFCSKRTNAVTLTFCVQQFSADK